MNMDIVDKLKVLPSTLLEEKVCNDAISEIESLRTQLSAMQPSAPSADVLVEALRFYALGGHFYASQSAGDELFGVPQCVEYGEKAEEALAAYEVKLLKKERNDE